MKKVTIQVPEGYEIDKENSTFEEIRFKEKKKCIKDRVKSFIDICSILGKCESSFNHEDKNVSAYMKIKAVAEVFNEDWYPDFSNSSEYKYAPYFELKNESQVLFFVVDWVSGTAVPAPLFFKSEDLARYAAETFEDIYKDLIAI